jgi:branched-chain amino acid transport system substrate-binding protein
VMWNAFMGWTGIDQYDEGNQMGQRFLDEFKEKTGRRPEWCVPGVNRARHQDLLRQLDPQGWMGSGYLVARELAPDGVNSRLVARFGEE